MKYKIILLFIALTIIPLVIAGQSSIYHTLPLTASGGAAGGLGAFIYANQNFTLRQVGIFPGTTGNTIAIYNETGTLLNYTIYSGTPTAVNISYNLTAGSGYFIEMNVTTGSYTAIASSNIPGILPINGSYFDWVNGSNARVKQVEGGFYNIFFLTIETENSTLSRYSTSYNLSAYETGRESFISLFNTTGVSSVNLIHNNTAYPGTATQLHPSAWQFSRTIDLSLLSGTNPTKTFFWNVTFTNGSTVSTTFEPQYTSQINLTICGSSPQNTRYVNYTFKDEATSLGISANVSSSSFVYYLGQGSINRTFSFTNNTGLPSYSLCFSPPNRTVTVDPEITYSSTGYEQRTYAPSLLSLTNTTSNITLYLLGSSDGLFVTFQVINAAEQPLENVYVNATRDIGGITTVVGSGFTGADGGITFWLNPDVEHTFAFELAPYPLYTTSIFPTQSTYTVTLGSSVESNASDYNKGITYSVKPISTYLSNGTYYNFNFTLNSTFWSLDQWGFNITNGSGFLLATNVSTAANGGFLSSNLSTGQNGSIILNYYWIINGTKTEASRNWIVLDMSDSSYSISNLITHLATYTATGLFGVTDFGIGILCFLIILGVTGVLKLKYGMTNESALVGVLFGAVALFDIGFGLLPNPIGAVANFPTIFMGIVFAGFLFKEVFR